MDLTGKVALVTGAARGIGRSIALGLARSGAMVWAVDLLEDQLKDMATHAGEENLFVKVQNLDVSKVSDVQACVAGVLEAHGRFDILVNAAGINRDATLIKMTDENWDSVLAVNLSGTFYFMREAAKIMRNQGSGRIVNISSASWLGNFGQSNYAASKAGVVGLTLTAAKELARKNITVNAICPGFIETEMTRGVPEKVWDMMVDKIPMGRVGQPEDVANLVAFLSSDLAGYITGEVIYVGGGFKL